MKKRSLLLAAALALGGFALSAGQARAGQVSPQTKTAIAELACVARRYPVAILGCLWDKPALKFERRTPPNYQSLPPLRAPEAKDFRSLLPPFQPLSR